MPRFFCVFFVCIILALISPAHAADGEFFHEEIAASAERYEQKLAQTPGYTRRSSSQWKRLGDRAQRKGDIRAAAANYAAAATLAPASARTWFALAGALAATQPKDNNERYDLQEQASSAAFLAYKRAGDKSLKANALAFLGRVLSDRQFWRPALDAYKASLSLRASPAIQTIYDGLREQRGFRSTNYSVDSDAVSPRMCIQFSENLALVKDGYSKFIRVDGAAAAAVSADQRQLCVEGLRHGTRYNVDVRAGLPSVVDETLLKPARFTVYVRDRKPAVHFSGRGYVLPRTGQSGIPIISVNTKEIDIAIYRIGDRSLGSMIVSGEIFRQMHGGSLEDLASQKGEKVWSGKMPVESPLNKDVTTAFPVDEALPKLQPGIYVVAATATADKTEYWGERPAQWFVVSDMGVAAISGDDGIHAFIRSLTTAAPMKGVELRLLAMNNEILGTATTDVRGAVRFDPGLTRGKGGLAPAVLVASGPGGDYSFLEMNKPGFDLSDRGVTGRPAPTTLDAYLFTERGVYRPGADVHVTALLRDRKANAVPDVPLTLVFERPDGVEQKRALLPDQGAGGRSFTLGLLDRAMTGTWRVKAFADPKGVAVGETTFLVEDFVPDRMELTLSSPGKSIKPSGSAKLNVSGRYLYGAPAAGLALEGEIIVRPRSGDLEGFPGYVFGLADEKVTPVRRPLFDLPKTGKDGNAEVNVPLPPLPQSTRLMAAEISMRLREPGGQAVQKRITLPVTTTAPMIGIRPGFKDGHAGEHANALFDVLAAGPKGSRVVMKDVRWQLFHIEQHYQWYRRHGSWNFEPITKSERVGEGRIDLNSDAPISIEAPVKFGRYRLEVASAKSDGAASSVTFTAGWYAADPAETPDFLEIALDKPRYKPGETARVSITPRVAGTALVAVVNDGVVAMKAVEAPASGANVEFEVGSDWGPGAYVTAMLYRPMNVPAKRMPQRSVGVSWLPIDTSDRMLALKLDTPEKIAPNQTLDIPVEISGLEPGKSAHMVVSTVDVGILNLTGYEPPAPEDWYFAQRRLGVEFRDLYGRLIDGMHATRGKLRVGGDDGGMGLKGAPPTQRPLALYSGIVSVNADGKARVSFEVPQFSGTLRVMAAAWSPGKLAHATKDVIVREPIIVTGSLPRFLAKGDQSRLHLSIHNVEGADGKYSLDIEAQGPVETTGAATRSLTLKAGARTEHVVQLKANGIGDAILTARLTGPDGKELQREFALGVVPASPVVTSRSTHVLAARKGSLTLDKNLLSSFVPGTVKATLNVTPGAGLDMAGVLLALDRYPYGCAEQITSRALPLLYVNTIAEHIGLDDDTKIPERIDTAIKSLLAMQSSSGGFGVWGPDNGDMWLSAYVTEFLMRAREAGHKVPDIAYENALDRLQNYLTNFSDFKQGGETLAYSAYVLARTGRANIGDLRYFADAQADSFTAPLAGAHLAAALAMLGDRTRAEKLFSSAIQGLEAPPVDAGRSDFGSALRDRAGVLTLVAETGLQKSAIPAIARSLAATSAQKPRASTQENAWLLRAANALFAEPHNLSLTRNGQPLKGALFETFNTADLQKAPVKIANEGDTAVTAMVTISGAPLSPEPAEAKGFLIDRSYYTMGGKPREIEGVNQNERLVVVLRVNEVDARRGRILIVDHLPAGFEIENPRLSDAGSGQNFSWLKGVSTPEHSEYRKDRFVAAFNRDGQKPQVLTVSYVVRVVSPGQYAHPPATVEDMYRPELFARTATGTLNIAGPGR